MSVLRPGVTPGIAAALGWEGSDISYVSKFGLNSDVDATAAAEDIWQAGGLYTGFPTGAAETVDVVSTSASDTAAGTGMRTLMLSGLDANYVERTEAVTLNGLTAVTTSSTWTRVNHAWGLTAGSGGTNAGDVTIKHHTTTTNVFVQMTAGVGSAQACAYTVPAGKQAAIAGYRASVSNNGGAGTAARVQVGLWIRPFGAMWYRLRSLWIQNTSGLGDVALPGALVLPAKTDIVARAESGASADNLSVTASFDLFLVKA